MNRNDIESRKCSTPIDDNQYDDCTVTISSIEKDNKRVHFPRYYQHKELETSEGTDSSQQKSLMIVQNKLRKTVLKSFTSGKHDGTRNVQAGKIQKSKKKIKRNKVQDKENAYQMTDNRRKKSNVKKKRMKNVIPLESSTTSPNISSLESPSSNCSSAWKVPEEIRDAPRIQNFSEKLSPLFRQEIISEKEEVFENPQLLSLNNNLVVDLSEISIVVEEEEFIPFNRYNIIKTYSKLKKKNIPEKLPKSYITLADLLWDDFVRKHKDVAEYTAKQSNLLDKLEDKVMPISKHKKGGTNESYVVPHSSKDIVRSSSNSQK